MSKLFALKKYLTVEAAAKYLSNALGEPVLISDIYSLALDKHLTMSFRLNNQTYVRSGEYISNQDDASTEPVFDEPVQAISGIWDLAMIGLEAHEIEKLYQKEVGGIVPRFTGLNGFFLKRDELFYKYQESLLLDNSEESKNIVLERIDHLLKPKGITINDIDGTTSALDCLNDAELDEFMGLVSMLMYCESEEPEENDIYLSLEDISYQLVIRKDEITNFVQSLESTPQKIEPLIEKVSTKNNNKQTYNKAQTQIKYKKWQREALKLKKAHPGKPKTWIAAKIAKLPIAEGKSADTIRKNIKI